MGSKANLRQLRQTLPQLLLPLRPGVFGSDYHLTDELVALGVTYVSAFPAAEPGTIYLRHEGWANWENRGELNDWVLRVLARESDVGDKLATHGGIERHAFIWATPSSPWDVNAVLRDEAEALGLSIPTAAPTLPSSITHIWVASTWTPHQALVTRDNRWHRVEWPREAGKAIGPPHHGTGLLALDHQE